MNNHIEALLNNNYLYLLNDIEKNYPEEFKKSALELKGEDSLFLSFFKKDDSFEFISQLLPKLESYGYSILNETKTPKSQYPHSTLFAIPNKTKIPDVLWAISKTSKDKTAEFMLRHIGEKAILDLESQGWPVFKMIATKGFVASAQYLATTNSNFNLTDSDQSTALSAAEKNKDILAIYWQKMNQSVGRTHMPENEFFHFNELIEKKASSIYRKQPSEVSSIMSLIESNKDRLNKTQQLEILKSTLSALDKTLFKGVLKTFSLKIKDEDVSLLLLKNLRNAGQMEYGYLFLNEPSLVKKTIDNHILEGDEIKHVKKYGIDHVDDLLKNLNISLSFEASTRYRTREEKMASAVLTRLRDSIGQGGYDFLFKTLEDSDKTLFQALTEKKGATFKMVALFDVANISTHREAVFKFKTITSSIFSQLGKITLTEEQIDEVKDLLNNTWFKKQANNSSYIEQFDFWQLSRKKIDVLNPHLALPAMTDEHKIAFLRWGFANIDEVNLKTKNSDNHLSVIFNNVYEEMRNREYFDWKSLNINMEKLEKVKDSEIYFEVKALIMKSDLQKSLPKTKDSTEGTQKRLKM